MRSWCDISAKTRCLTARPFASMAPFEWRRGEPRLRSELRLLKNDGLTVIDRERDTAYRAGSRRAPSVHGLQAVAADQDLPIGEFQNMPLDYARLKSWSSPDIRQRYSQRDTILHALSVGAGIALDNGSRDSGLPDLPYIYGPTLAVLPTLATVLACDPLWLRNPALDVDWRQVVHGEQFLTMHQPLPAEGEVVGRSRVDEVYDKGPGRGAVLRYSIDLFDAADNTHYATVGLSAFIRGQGGFGGCASPAPAPHPLPDRSPDASLELPTRTEQAALYRLSGDLNPMHIDPAAAREAGFDRPVLHGLCYYSVACRALLKLL